MQLPTSMNTAAVIAARTFVRRMPVAKASSVAAAKRSRSTFSWV